jgi:hypothetical protein
MKALALALALMFAAHEAGAACAQKRSRDPSFVELMVPDGAPRPAGVDDFRFITDETTYDQLVATVGPPDAAQGTRVSYFIWCFADGTELSVATKDRVIIEFVRHQGKKIFKRGKK